MVGVVKPTKILTKDGECEISISIELNINLNNNIPVVDTKITTQQVETPKTSVKKEEDNWVIPDFTNLKKVQFGKEIS